jgi:hypothetical protein
MSSDDDQLFSEALRKVFWPTLFIVVVIFLLFNALANAHDPKNPALDGWYDSLKSDRGDVCCTHTEPIIVDGWEYQGGHYWIFLRGQWQQVPDDAVVKKPNLAGRAMIWQGYPKNASGPIVIRCFLPGTMT